MGIHILLLALSVGQPFEPTASAPTNSAEVSKLITQLGSNQFKEREAATQALNVLGAPALTPLRQAAQAKDPEIRHRAEILAQQIQKRLETAQILEPKRVRLVLSDRPLSEAVAELAGKTGFPIQLEGATKDRRITLDTGTTTFWEALDQFCRKAELVERAPPAVHGQEVRIWNARAGAPGQMVVIDRASRMSGPPGADDRLTLVPSRDKPPLLPTCYAGAVRIRAVSPAGKAWGQGKDETAVILEVTPEPKLSWQGTTEVRIDKAIDDQGQALFPSLTNEASYAESVARRVGNGVVVVDSETGRTVTSSREYPVRLKRADKASRVLKEVTGAVTAQVKAPPQVLLTVDDIFKAKGQTVHGLHGTSVKVIEATRQAPGFFRLKLQLEGPPEVLAIAGVRRARGNRIFVRNGALQGMVQGGGDAADSNLELLDGAGRSLLLSENTANWHINGNHVVQELQAVYRAWPSGPSAPVSSRSAKQVEALKLVYSNRRILTIEVPFTLKDVPLP